MQGCSIALFVSVRKTCHQNLVLRELKIVSSWLWVSFKYRPTGLPTMQYFYFFQKHRLLSNILRVVTNFIKVYYDISNDCVDESTSY